MVAKGPEFGHVGFVSSDKHWSDVFFRWVALRFREKTKKNTFVMINEGDPLL